MRRVPGTMMNVGKHTLDYTRDGRVAKPATIWDQDEPPLIVQRGPWRGPAVVAVVIAWLTSPPVLGAAVLTGHYVVAERPSLLGAFVIYFIAVLSTPLGFVATAIAYRLNTSPKARRERAMYRHAVYVNLLTLACNVALFVLVLVAMVIGSHGNG